MQLSAEQIARYAQEVVERYKTEPLREMRTGRELAMEMQKWPAGTDMQKIVMKTVGKKFDWNGLRIEVYTDEASGITIACDAKLRSVDCKDGVVFVWSNGKQYLLIHGAWEDLLMSICK